MINLDSTSLTQSLCRLSSSPGPMPLASGGGAPAPIIQRVVEVDWVAESELCQQSRDNGFPYHYYIDTRKIRGQKQH